MLLIFIVPITLGLICFSIIKLTSKLIGNEVEADISETQQSNKENKIEEKRTEGGIGYITLQTNEGKKILLSCPICLSQKFEIRKCIFRSAFIFYHSYKIFQYFKCENCMHLLSFKGRHPWYVEQQSAYVNFQVSDSK